MKNSFFCFITFIAALLTIAGCKRENPLALDKTQVTPVSNLFAPENNKFVQITSGSTGSVVFEWEQSRADDNGVVLYEILFDKADGDFSKPLYSATSDNNGLLNRFTVSYTDLNKIAANAGVKSLESRKFKWAVRSSRGINVQTPIQFRIIEIQRPEGIEAPPDLYITGSATEGGEDLSKALRLKQTEPGKFEVYTSLKAGTYHFVNRNTGTPTTYSNNGTKLTESGTTTVTGATQVVKLELNFNNASFIQTQIVAVGLWFAPDNKVWYDLPYVSGGVWQINNASVVFKQESFGRDERYKFRFTLKDAAGATSTQFYGSTKGDNNRADATTPPSYFYLVPVSSAQYDNSFKFASAADNKTADIRVDFSATATAYTHSVTVK
ncbi:SusE domain-containing protein [Mucilaginibacter sp.]